MQTQTLAHTHTLSSHASTAQRSAPETASAAAACRYSQLRIRTQFLLAVIEYLACNRSAAPRMQIESVAYTHTLKELALNVNTQQAITRDNVTIRIDGVLYIRIVDAFKASYGVDRPLYAVMQLAQTSMRSELGKMTLDNTFEERDTLNEKIVQVRVVHVLRAGSGRCSRSWRLRAD